LATTTTTAAQVEAEAKAKHRNFLPVLPWLSSLPEKASFAASASTFGLFLRPLPRLANVQSRYNSAFNFVSQFLFYLSIAILNEKYDFLS